MNFSGLQIIEAGSTFGRLTVLRPQKDEDGSWGWLAACVCGLQVIRSAKELLAKKRDKHCKIRGCLRRQRPKPKPIKDVENLSLRQTWRHMLERCQNPENSSYRHYGGRGIGVCERWQVFEHFLTDVGKKPTKKHSLDRIDNDGDYTPTNVRWATWTAQANNRRSNIHLTYKGRTQTLQQWAETVDLHHDTLRSRYKNGWTISNMLTSPLRSKHYPKKNSDEKVYDTRRQ